MSRVAQAFAGRRSWFLLALGFSSGIPAGPVGDNLAAWLKSSGISTQSIGMLSLLGLPFVLKFVWAPLMDRYRPPVLGRRRGWVLLCQLALAVVFAGMAACSPASELQPLVILALLAAFLSASQDIAGDAYRADVLPPAQRGIGAAAWVIGWRIAFILLAAQGMSMVGRGWLAWSDVYLISATLVAACILATVFAPEPQSPAQPPSSLRDAVILPLANLLERRDGLLVLAFVFLFRAPDALAKAMTLPFLMDNGVPQQQIGDIRQGVGMAVTLAGAAFGGALVAAVPLRRVLLLVGVLQALSNLAFLAMTATGPRLEALIAVVVVENFCGGMVTAAFLAFLMGQCNASFSAFQFALLTGVMRLTDLAFGTPSGFLASALGWDGFFLASVLVGVPGVLLIRLVPTQATPEMDTTGPKR